MNIIFPSLLLFAAAHAEGTRNVPNTRKLSDVRLRPKHQLESGIQAIQSTEWAESIRRAINPLSSSRKCSSPLDDWTIQLVDEMGYDTAKDLIEYGVDILAFVYKLFVEYDEEGEYFGVEGKETDDLITNHEGCEVFWSNADNGHTLNTDDIVLLGVHGRDLKHYSKLYATIELLVKDGTTESEVREAVFAYQAFIESLPHGYNNPLLTANALASSDVASSESFSFGGDSLPDSILIGDGMIEYLRSQNLGKDGPEYVHAHEFAHHMQFEVDIALGSVEEESAADSRRIELMADAFGAYYLAHEEGAGMSGGRMREVQKAAYSAGDCSTTEQGHHGTPAQRECAAMWGANQANSNRDRDSIMHPETLRGQFDNALPNILNLDENICQYSAISNPGPGDNDEEVIGNGEEAKENDGEEIKNNGGLSVLAIVAIAALVVTVSVATVLFIVSNKKESQESRGPIEDEEDWVSEEEGNFATIKL